MTDGLDPNQSLLGEDGEYDLSKLPPSKSKILLNKNPNNLF